MPKIIWGAKNNLDLGFGIGIWDLGFWHLDFEFGWQVYSNYVNSFIINYVLPYNYVILYKRYKKIYLVARNNFEYLKFYA